MLRIVPRRILPERVFGRPVDDERRLEARHRADALAHQRDRLALDLRGGARGTGLQHQQPERHLALERVGDAHDRAFGDIGMRRQHLLHPAGRQSVRRRH